MLKGKTLLSILVLIAMAILFTFAGCKRGPTQDVLFEKAKKAQEASDFKGAIEAYQEIVKRFPKSALAPQCMFMTGYLYANHLKQIDLAKQSYATFIRTFPEHELVKDAQWELDHLGKDVNEIEELNKILGKDSLAAKVDTVKKAVSEFG